MDKKGAAKVIQVIGWHTPENLGYVGADIIVALTDTGRVIKHMIRYGVDLTTETIDITHKILGAIKEEVK